MHCSGAAAPHALQWGSSATCTAVGQQRHMHCSGAAAPHAGSYTNHTLPRHPPAPLVARRIPDKVAAVLPLQVLCAVAHELVVAVAAVGYGAGVGGIGAADILQQWSRERSAAVKLCLHDCGSADDVSHLSQLRSSTDDPSLYACMASSPRQHQTPRNKRKHWQQTGQLPAVPCCCPAKKCTWKL
jgi:hypothetical protein